MPQPTLPERTLRTTFWLSALFVLVFGVRGDMTIALGLTIGSALGLFSLWSLHWAVPRLTAGANPFSKFLLGMLMVAKLPIYAGVLSFSMVSPLVNPFAVFVGVALVPIVIVLKVVGAQMLERANLSAGEKACREISSL